MYRIRRVYRTKPGEAGNVAKLVYAQAKLYRDAGHRSDFTVSYNGYNYALVEIGGQCWFAENLQYAAGLKYSMLDYTDTVERLKMMRDVEGAPLWYGHSIAQYETMGEKWYK